MSIVLSEVLLTGIVILQRTKTGVDQAADAKGKSESTCR
jgi:hypothetical protein